MKVESKIVSKILFNDDMAYRTIEANEFEDFIYSCLVEYMKLKKIPNYIVIHDGNIDSHKTLESLAHWAMCLGSLGDVTIVDVKSMDNKLHIDRVDGVTSMYLNGKLIGNSIKTETSTNWSWER